LRPRFAGIAFFALRADLARFTALALRTSAARLTFVTLRAGFAFFTFFAIAASLALLAWRSGRTDRAGVTIPDFRKAAGKPFHQFDLPHGELAAQRRQRGLDLRHHQLTRDLPMLAFVRQRIGQRHPPRIKQFVGVALGRRL
jgi:hypothetical protein